MSWRCQNCDYEGREVISTDEHDEGCPECQGYCLEVEEMTQDQEDALASFFEDNLGDFIVPSGRILNNIECYHNQLMFEDWNEARVVQQGNGVYAYTIINCEDDEAWLFKGYRWVDRVGYYFTTREIEIPEEGLRYW